MNLCHHGNTQCPEPMPTSNDSRLLMMMDCCNTRRRPIVGLKSCSIRTPGKAVTVSTNNYAIMPHAIHHAAATCRLLSRVKLERQIQFNKQTRNTNRRTNRHSHFRIFATVVTAGCYNSCVHLQLICHTSRWMLICFICNRQRTPLLVIIR